MSAAASMHFRHWGSFPFPSSNIGGPDPCDIGAYGCHYGGQTGDCRSAINANDASICEGDNDYGANGPRVVKVEVAIVSRYY